jgi:membrane protein YdbS with pleckstrin-like domain
VAGLPAKLLNPGEQVELDSRPHWKFLALPVAWVAALVVAAAFSLVAGAPRWAQLALAAVLVVALVWLAGRWLRWVTSSFVVTTQRLVVRRGVLGRTAREIPLDRLTDVTCRQSLLDRLVGCGDVLVESPGRDSPEVFPDLPRPLLVQSLISRLAVTRTAPPAAAVVPPGPSVAQQLAELGELRRRGLISRREFAAKKAQLLSRM